MDNIETFTAEDCIQVHGRGYVCFVQNPRTCDWHDLHERYLGQRVSIDGRDHKVRGFEGCASPLIPAGARIGFVVYEPPAALEVAA